MNGSNFATVVARQTRGIFHSPLNFDSFLKDTHVQTSLKNAVDDPVPLGRAIRVELATTKSLQIGKILRLSISKMSARDATAAAEKFCGTTDVLWVTESGNPREIGNKAKGSIQLMSDAELGRLSGILFEHLIKALRIPLQP